MSRILPARSPIAHALALALGLGLALASCRGPSVPQFREDLVGTCWRLTSLDGHPIAGGPESVTLCFEQEGRIRGSGGCNTYDASVRFEGDAVSIGTIGSTRMACEPVVMQREQLFFRRLERARRWLLDGQDLLLFGEEPPAMRFARLPG